VYKATILGMVCLFFAGCGETKPDPDPSVVVSGIVTMDGKPLDRAMVMFIPMEGAKQGNGGSGLTDSSGKYELSSQVAEKTVVGTPPGKYKVVISKMIKPDGTVADASEPPMMSAARESIPLQYSGFASSKLTETVSTSGGTYNFDLKSK
jgi:hypothetical protein